jgi:hypothetical protein
MIKMYRPFVVLRLLHVFIFLFTFVMWSLLFLFLYQLGVEPLVLILLVGMFLGGLIYGIWRTSQIRLEISDDGIKYFSGYYTISTSWDNVERVGQGVPNNLLNFPVDGLVLRHASAIKPSLVASIFLSGGMGYYKVDYSRSIPLQGIWSWNWRKSKLAEDIPRYLPEML